MLRKRIAKIDQKYATPEPPPPPPKINTPSIEEWMSGEVVETAQGQHFETTRLFERHRRHGSVGIVDLEDMEPTLLDVISEGAIKNSPPARWAFLDTETTGLAGGTGTYPFLIGVGHITPQGFLVKQFFMRDYGEEASQLAALSSYLEQFDVMITYNGKSYDQPLLETRYRMSRAKPPFARMEHLDLLFSARRLWKLRFESCRLVELENRILGVERQGDVPGDLIPYLYFEYLKTKEAFRLAPVFHHNAIDILTLACLTGIVPRAFDSPVSHAFAHGAEMAGLARWLRSAERFDDAAVLFRRAIDKGLPDALMFRTMWDLAMLEKKQGREDAAIALYTELTQCRNEFQVDAHEELAKFYEHKERNYSMALDLVEAAIRLRDSAELRKRKLRLETRLRKPQTRKLL